MPYTFGVGPRGSARAGGPEDELGRLSGLASLLCISRFSEMAEGAYAAASASGTDFVGL
jgi:hypothetical protein